MYQYGYQYSNSRRPCTESNLSIIYKLARKDASRRSINETVGKRLASNKIVHWLTLLLIVNTHSATSIVLLLPEK